MSDRPNEPVAPPAPLTPEQIHAWLSFELESLTARKTELLATSARWQAAHPIIDSDDLQGEAAENRRMLSTLTSTAESRRKERKATFLDGGRAVDSWFASFGKAIDTALNVYRARMNVYAEAKVEMERKARNEAARRAQEEADRQQAAAAAAMEQAAQPAEAEAALDRAAEAAQAAERAEKEAAAPVVEQSRVRGEFGAVASLKTTWAYEVENEDIIPRNLLSPDDGKIKGAIKAAGRDANGVPRAKLPGIRIFAKRTT